ncbi:MULTISPECIES: exopolyphosphatase [Silvimonas]|uniref:exopolyphosphatase n=1 Tax=Silvimonas TaxID=300264 RepID=UPI0024B34B85|nr:MULTISPECIES: exopolyphosphatase [Silvimonas]MDR3430059.1 exopolyphosphatase [Silvimonas sp.]
MFDDDLIAAVDLGSNSFRLQVARSLENTVVPLDTFKETVRLGAGLDARNYLTPQAQQQALAALARFGERLRGMRPEQVRAVATNTFRVAKNGQEFLPLAEAALGFPIEIIGGREEARLIYLGASHSLPSSREKRLVVDIGGGSTEFIVGRQHAPLITESTLMGCVSWSLRFFPDGVITPDRLAAAEIAAGEVIQPLEQEFHSRHWDMAIGTSGTARSLADVMELNDIASGGITRGGLSKIRHILLEAGHVDKVKLNGLRDDRRPVLAGGFAIMAAVFDLLAIERMQITQGALRDGVLYDLLGRHGQHDVRSQTVTGFLRRYHTDAAQAQRVAALAQSLAADLPQVNEALALDVYYAAMLHEVGRAISHTSYHKHSAYILQHSDMPGFSRREQAQLASLALAQRGKLEKAGKPSGEALWQAVLALRLACIVHRARNDDVGPDCRLSTNGKRYTLSFESGWLAARPLTRHALIEETHAWQTVGHELAIVEHNV